MERLLRPGTRVRDQPRRLARSRLIIHRHEVRAVTGHSVAFREAVLSQEAHDNALAAAKALALTAIDVLVDPEVLRKARAEFEDRRAKGIVKGRT